MRKLFILICLLVVTTHVPAQSLSLQQKLFYTCKVWGLVKYYHSNVSTCHINWDSVMVSLLPAVRNATDDSEFNDVLDTLLASAGVMAIATTLPPPLPALELRRNLNFGWFHDTILRRDVSVQLDTIRNNFRPATSCYFMRGFTTNSDLPLLDVNTTSSYPDADHRQLMFFKYWNIINYFNPYNYVLDKPIDTLLFNNLIPIDTVSDASELFMAIRRITAGLNDAHVGGATYSNPLSYNYWYLPRLMIRYIESKYVVVQSGVVSVPVGSSVVSVDGVSVNQMEASMKNYVSAGNLSVFRRFMYKYLLLGGHFSSTFKLVFARPSGGLDSTVLIRNTLWGDSSIPEYYYPADSLASIHWTTIGCGIGYLNVGNLTIGDADSAYAHLRNAPAIIIDSRNYPISNCYNELTNLMYASPQVYETIDIVDTTYPGTFYALNNAAGVAGNPTPYAGMVILLLNEESQSAAEVGGSVVFERLPRVIKIGSQTAGACGASFHFNITRDIYTAFTAYSIYYPNGDSLQRIGVVPDSVVKPTVLGILAGRDEVVEKAIQIGCKIASVGSADETYNSIKVFPNPVTNELTVTGPPGQVCYKLFNGLGVAVLGGILHAGQNTILISDCPPGIYLFESIDELGQRQVKKVLKE